MSGHSKWHNIQAKKSKVDARRGKIFTKIGKELMVAAKNGGSNIETNSKLKDVVAKAKAANMPMDTITRAIKKAAGELSSVVYEEITYEGYGTNGVAVIVETLTDNKNRTAGNVRHAFSKHGGNMGSSGCVSFMFQKKGEIIIEKNDSLDEDELMMMALDAGAEDFASEDEVYVITTEPSSFGTICDSLKDNGIELLEAEVKMIPDTTTELDMNSATKFQKLIDELEDDDDVQDVWHNAEFPDDFEG